MRREERAWGSQGFFIFWPSGGWGFCPLGGGQRGPGPSSLSGLVSGVSRCSVGRGARFFFIDLVVGCV
jgi:hypothetical protein